MDEGGTSAACAVDNGSHKPPTMLVAPLTRALLTKSRREDSAFSLVPTRDTCGGAKALADKVYAAKADRKGHIIMGSLCNRTVYCSKHRRRRIEGGKKDRDESELAHDVSKRYARVRVRSTWNCLRKKFGGIVVMMTKPRRLCHFRSNPLLFSRTTTVWLEHV